MIELNKHLELYWVDAFTSQPFGGNPAAIIINADNIPDEQKQVIARELNVSETVFISKSQVANFKVQFFTPKQETVLCGHGTIGAFWLLGSIGKIENRSGDFVCVMQETKAGILPIEVHFDKNKMLHQVVMHQTFPEFSGNDINSDEIAKILGVSANQFESGYPLKIVSTGRPKLFIPIKNRDVLYDIKPDFNMMVDYCIQQSITGFHLFTFDTHEPDSITTARHFAPVAGVNEDPVTGIAAGALGCYLSEFAKDKLSISKCQMEQGFNMGRKGIIYVEIYKEGRQYKSVKVGGKAYMLFNTKIKLG